MNQQQNNQAYINAGNIINRSFKKYLLKDVVNIDVSLIPGIYRKRFKLNNSNLEQPIKKIIKNNSYEDDLNKAILASLNISDTEINSMDMGIILNNSQDIEINKAIMESFNISTKSDEDFWVCIDLRIYGPNPYQPLYFNNKEYYFNYRQVDSIVNNWNKVNSETIFGERKIEDIMYYKLETKQLEKNNYFIY